MYYAGICIAGVFIFDENKKLIDYKLFKKDPEQIAKKLDMFEKHNSFDELDELKKKYNLVIEQPNPASDFLRENLRKIVIEVKFVKNQNELNELMNKVSIIQVKSKISSMEKRDKLIVQAVSAYSDVDKIINYMIERLREWYGLHYPEFSIQNHEKFTEYVIKYGYRENFEKFEKSMGMKLKKEDIEIIQEYAKHLKNMYELRKDIENYLNKVVPEEVPNLNALLGSILAAKLLAQAGSLEKLAKMPSSAIQLLGAEKSLFKYLKGKEGMKGPPRFGILFVHPDIQTSKRELQGRIARLLSSKLTLAARADFYSKQDISKQLLTDYKEKLSKIKSE